MGGPQLAGLRVGFLEQLCDLHAASFQTSVSPQGGRPARGASVGRGCAQSSKEGEKQRNMARALPYPSGIPEYGWFPPSSASHLPYLKSHPFSSSLTPSPRTPLLKPS